jgi:hypothetical protein
MANPFRYNKYGNQPAESRDGKEFHSKRERNRYEELLALEQGGAISDLKLQPGYKLVVNKILITNYFADFSYVDDQGKRVVEDTKGVRTPAYVMKKRLMKAIYGIEVLES